MKKNEKLEEDKIFFKAIEEEETRIVTKEKTSANFAMIKSYFSWLQEKSKKQQA